MISKTLILFSLGLFVSVATAAQIITSSQVKHPDTVYMKNSGRVVSNKDSADYSRIITQDSTDSKLCVVKEFYPGGRLKTSGKSLAGSRNIRPQGTFTQYFANGNVKSVTHYDNGKPVGQGAFYFPNGKPYYTAAYDTAKKKLRINNVSDSAGKVMAENGKGTCAFYDTDFKRVTAQGPIIDGLKDGQWMGSMNDTVTYVCTYSQGESVSGTSYQRSGKINHFTKDEIEPVFTGGLDAFYKFLAHEVHYPKLAKKNNVQGKVFLSFMIDNDGTLTNVKVVRGIGSGCDEESVRVLKMSPPWQPGYQYGVAVRVMYSIPLTFSLTQDD